jgi:dTDP-D-glucose 4,6-dehydratase
LIKQRLSWAPSTSLASGMERTYAWIHGEMTKAESERKLAYR